MRQSKNTDVHLPTLCEGAYKQMEDSWSKVEGTRPVKLVWVHINEERTLWDRIVCEDNLCWDVQLINSINSAQDEGYHPKVETVLETVENFMDQDIATQSDGRIEEIHKQWQRKNGVTPASAFKLVLAHFNAAAAMLKHDVVIKINKFASADWDLVDDAIDEIEDSETPLMTKIIRDRVRDLAMMFGSPDNLISYYEALRQYASDCSRDKAKKVEMTDGRKYNPSSRSVRDECYTIVKDSAGKAQWKHWQTLVEYLMDSLDQETVVVYGKVREDGSRPKYTTCISREEMCEMIGLKLALGIRHQAMNIEEIQEMKFSLERMAAATQKRCVVESSGYDNDEEDDQEALGIRFRDPETKEIVELMGYFTKDYAKNRVVTIEEDVVTGSRGERVIIDKSRPALTRMSILKHDGEWVSCGRSGASEWVRKEVVEEKLFNIEPIIKRVSRQVVKSNTTVLPREEHVSKDWDVFFSVRSPSYKPDHRFPCDKNGVFPDKYYGPSFVRIVDGVVKKADRCAMHDGQLMRQWYKAGKPEEGPETCPDCHMQKVTINPDHWEPKVDVVNWYCKKCGIISYNTDELCHCGSQEFSSVNVTMLADKKHMRRVWTDNGYGKMKPSLEFDHDGMRMPLLNSHFKRYIKECVWLGDFAAPPVLDEQFKAGELRGKDLEAKEALEADIELLSQTSHPGLFSKMKELEILENKAHNWDFRKTTLHVYVSLNNAQALSLFDLEDKRLEIPKDMNNMAIKVQLTGLRSHLVRICRENGGTHVKQEYKEDGKKQWILVKKVVDGDTVYQS